MEIVHIKLTQEVDNSVMVELINLLQKYGFKTEKYLGMSSKIIMARKSEEKA